MAKKHYKLTAKMVSVIMSLLFIVLSVPFAFAAEPVILSESNVVTWPTIEGEIYFGQKLSDGFTVSGGLVTTDGTAEGTVIPGKFEFIDPSYIPTSTNGIAAFKFTPNNTQDYSGFEVEKVYDVMYTVNKVTPVLVDENNPPVASEVEAGARLSTSKITGGQMKNPYNPEESKVLSKTWTWSNGRTTVSESGYYEAKFAPGSGYEIIKMDIYVRIAGDTPETTIETYPTVNVTYDPNLKWSDVKFEGGKAVIKGTTTEVPGTFAVTDKWKDVTPATTNTKVELTFTPDDETQALPYTFEIPVTVNKAVPTFKTDDESGVPTITMPYGTKLDSSLDYKIKPLVDVDVPVYLAYKDMEGNELSYNGTTPVVGTHEIQVRVNIDDSNYETFTMLTFNLEITGFESSCIVVPVGSEGYKIVDEGIAYNVSKPTGTFTVSYTINGEKQPDITVKYGELFQIEKVKSGDYVFTVTYNEIENDPFSVVVKTFEIKEKLGRNVKIGDSTQKYTYGDTVTVTAPATDPAKPDKPYYGFTGWEVKGNIGLSDEELAKAEISFAMPDEDVELNATYEFSLKLFFEWIWQQIVQFFTFFINAMKDLFALAVA